MLNDKVDIRNQITVKFYSKLCLTKTNLASQVDMIEIYYYIIWIYDKIDQTLKPVSECWDYVGRYSSDFSLDKGIYLGRIWFSPDEVGTTAWGEEIRT